MTAPPKYTKVASEDPSEQESGIPIRSSSPSDVRAYIVHLLVNQHGVTSEAAHAVANKWTLGRGFDFLEASSKDFKEIFGTDLGRHIYRSTAHDEWLRWNNEDVQTGFRYLLLIAGFFAGLNFLSAASSSSGLDALRSLAWIPTILAVPYLFHMSNCPVHSRGRYKAGIYLMLLAVFLWIVYALQLPKRG
ncbi:hypothetical protein VHEMI04125 [[Torrubiella] hemipterigena]|uniref:Uncharacterized protein n=1 Tax=[Torrubiella] hemipterigena TaxID=1531966 RepID=A0A0A1SUJ2_9HYPO|nr:hypothetical protein VHEMI04125 [[Torrubiella] hemipterigena]